MTNNHYNIWIGTKYCIDMNLQCLYNFNSKVVNYALLYLLINTDVRGCVLC
jgi:hypothetical protein